MSSSQREEALQKLEDKSKQNPRREFMALLAEVLTHDDNEDFDVQEVKHDSRGPLGGRSQQLVGIFTDSKGKQHGVIINAYVGEPDIKINEDGQVSH